MNVVNCVAKLVGIGAGIGADMIIYNIVKATTPKHLHILLKICIGIGGFAIGSLVADIAEDYMNDTIDDSILQLFGMFNPKEWTVKEVEA